MLGLTLLIVLIAILIKVKQKSKFAFILLILSPILFCTYNIWLYETHKWEADLTFKENSYRYRAILDKDIKNVPRISSKYIFGYYNDLDHSDETHYVRFCDVKNIKNASEILEDYANKKGDFYSDKYDLKYISHTHFHLYIENDCVFLSKTIKF